MVAIRSTKEIAIAVETYIAIATLNDFIFCPYSIYLHSVYMESDEDVYKATPQLAGSDAHSATNNRTSSSCKEDIMSLPIYSEELGISGVIDIYRGERHLLVERKNNLKQIFRGQIYQLWAQYFCMVEMGYKVDAIAFYEISSNKMLYQKLPTNEDKQELKNFIQKFRTYSPATTPFTINSNKCRHCIYCNLCDKTTKDNVYT